MHSHTCNCLNVWLDVSQLLAAAPAELPAPLAAEPLLAAGCFWVLLGPDGARAEHAALLLRQRPRGAEDWAVHRCLNCGVVTHAACDRPGAATAVSKHLLSDPARIAALRQSPSYSAAFRVVLPQLAGSLERAVVPPASPRSHPALAAALRAAKLTLNAFVKKEELRVEAAVQAFRDEKLAELKESKQRAVEQSQLFTGLLLRVQEQLRLSDGEPEPEPEPPRSQRSGRCDMVGMFLMDGEDDEVEVAEEAEEQYLPAFEEEPDTDDSGVEEPRPVPAGRGGRPEDLAMSLPVHIPVPDSLAALGRRRARDRDDEKVPDIDQMAASIRQLAQSLHTEPGLQFDLPRPRTNTMHR